MRRAPDIPTLRAAWWAQRALRVARRRLRSGTLTDVSLPLPPALPQRAARGVEALLRRRTHSCLEGALVRQRWRIAHGDPRDVIIAVSGPGDGFGAHAWVEGDPPGIDETMHELTRLRP